MAESSSIGAQQVKRTLSIKKIHDKDLLVDAYYVDSVAVHARPAILFFHGGYLISGDANFVPNWLIQAALRRGWILVSANYRTLPESTGLDLAEDLLDAFLYVSGSADRGLSHDLRKPGFVDRSRIVIAGSSGGGFCSVLATLEVLKRAARSSSSPEIPKPAVTVALYPMLDFLSPTWSIEGIDLGLSEDDAKAGRADLERRIASGNISFGERFPENNEEMVNHSRWKMMRYIIQTPVFIDYLTGTRGLSQKLAAVAKTADVPESVVPEKARSLFVLNFTNLTSDMPALFVIHGSADAKVPVADSDKFTEMTKALGVPTTYWRLDGFDHDFDLAYGDLEGDEGERIALSIEQDAGRVAIKQLLRGLDDILE